MNKIKRIIAGIMVLVLISSILPPKIAYAEIPEIAQKIDSDTVEVGSLIIGTHLIHISALNNKIYELAMKSAATSGQSGMYYKSELAGGNWFDITTASSIADITTAGTPISEKKIEELYYTHRTRSDGITYLIVPGQERYEWSRAHLGYIMHRDPPKEVPIDVYIYNDKYWPHQLDEMKSFNNQIEYADRVESYNQAMLIVWLTMKQLHSYYNEGQKGYIRSQETLEYYRQKYFKKGSSPTEIAIIVRAMDHVYAERYIDLFTYMDTNLKTLANRLMTYVPKVDDQLKPPDTLIQSIGEGQANLQTSITRLKGDLITKGDSVIEIYKYESYSKLTRILTDYFLQSYEGWSYSYYIEPAIKNLVDLENVENSNIVNRVDEFDLLKGTLVPSGVTRYKDCLKAGINDEYREARTNPQATALRDSIIKANIGSLNNKQRELEYFIEEYIDRTDKTSGIAFIDERLADALKFYNIVPQDDFRTGAMESIDAHIAFLKRLRNSLTGDKSENEKLEEEKQKLQDKLLEELDNNKVDDADNTRKQIEVIDNEIGAIEENNAYEMAILEEEVKKLEEELKDADEEKAEDINNKIGDAKDKIADVIIGSNDDSLIKKADDMKKDAQKAIDSDDKGALDNVIGGLIEVTKSDPKVSIPVIKDIRDQLKKKADDGNGTFDDQIKKVEDAIRDGAGAFEDAKNSKDIKDIEAVVGEYDSSDDKRNAAVVSAVAEYAFKDDNAGANDMVNNWLDKLLLDKNPYVFVRYNDGDNEYIPCDVLCYYTGMRYVWQKSQQIGTMSKSGNYYSFTVNTTGVNRDKDGSKTEQMQLTAKWQDIIHVTETYTKLQFDAEAYYIPNTIYGVLISPEMKVSMKDMLEKLDKVN